MNRNIAIPSVTLIVVVGLLVAIAWPVALRVQDRIVHTRIMWGSELSESERVSAVRVASKLGITMEELDYQWRDHVIKKTGEITATPTEHDLEMLGDADKYDGYLINRRMISPGGKVTLFLKP